MKDIESSECSECIGQIKCRDQAPVITRAHGRGGLLSYDIPVRLRIDLTTNSVLQAFFLLRLSPRPFIRDLGLRGRSR